MTRFFKMMIGSFSLIRKDPMLVLLLLAPWLAGAVFYLGLPALAPLLRSSLQFDLTEWYGVADMLLLIMTPMLAGVTSGFLILDERDEGVGIYFEVTPLGGSKYYASRLCLPLLYSIVIAPLLMGVLSLSHPAIWRVFAVAFTGGLFGAVIALLLPAFAANKVEGLAVSKFFGVLTLPMIIPFLTDSPFAYIAGVFPTYWMGALMQGSLWLLIPAAAVCGIWLGILNRFAHKTKN